MQIRTVTSSTPPQEEELLQGVKLVNLNVLEKIKEGITSYEYTQVVGTPDQETQDVIAEHEYVWAAKELQRVDLEIKYCVSASSRATLNVETWYKYQELLRDYATYDGKKYTLLTRKPIKPQQVV